jgi:hypothetical protein
MPSHQSSEKIKSVERCLVMCRLKTELEGTNLGSQRSHGSMNSTAKPYISQCVDILSRPIIHYTLFTRVQNLIDNGRSLRRTLRSGKVVFEDFGDGIRTSRRCVAESCSSLQEAEDDCRFGWLHGWLLCYTRGSESVLNFREGTELRF